ncbi:unnamed protein product [Didymodactylos carnosus]|uniref:Integrase catalytic domain-containing protein n=1 Tax=Didymodactylos carnosus TaxID=1234261 RepID=A0A814TZA0_9BILA|nr:unnamed protein product [Didymodactylos carnosus]CAF1166744.1 unnamed protein product [Didymodactylos carnosus]CAF3583398.1 unnamed protein product [Didymodactylos carnosus]CAF3930366.1 unnamed protein product [Didymodactylos carnosus]
MLRVKYHQLQRQPYLISECHIAVSHGGREKTFGEIQSHYSSVPRVAVDWFLKRCIACQIRKPVKQHVVSKSIVSLGVMTRLQIDLINMRSHPDVITIDIVYNWILHCIDNFSKFSWAFALRNKTAVEVASKLRELFFVFGPPRLLHSDNGKEFVANVIIELKQLFPEMCFVRGRPRRPQSQDCVERANGVLTVALGKWMSTNNSDRWSEGLLPVVYGINTRISSATKTTPFEVVFGQPPRSDSDFWKIVKEHNVEDEDQLPTVIAEADDGRAVDITSCTLNSNELVDDIDTDINRVVKKLTDDAVDVVCNSVTDLSSSNSHSDVLSQPSSFCLSSSIDLDLPSSSNSLLGLQSPQRHDAVRKRATDSYLNIVNKKRKEYDAHLKTTSKLLNINNCVVSINTLQNSYTVESLIDLKEACPADLKAIDVEELDDISFIEACKLYVRGALNAVTCDCKSQCATKHCPCKKLNVACSTKCHSKRGQCKNMQ